MTAISQSAPLPHIYTLLYHLQQAPWLTSLMQVVRRRAVPREVGPPPGGPALVHTQIPVVFFTQAGVPGEAADMGASSQGLAAVCTQAMDHLG